MYGPNHTTNALYFTENKKQKRNKMFRIVESAGHELMELVTRNHDTTDDCITPQNTEVYVFFE